MKTITEIPKRLTPEKADLIRLFVRSNNICSYPNCINNLFTASNAFVGEICHIEGALPNSARFNSSSSNKFRKSESNLILLCGHHHNIVDSDSIKYSVSNLQEMKGKHFLNNAKYPDYSLSETQLYKLQFWFSEITNKLQSLLENQNLSKHKDEPIFYNIHEPSLAIRTKQIIRRINLVISACISLVTILYVWYFFGISFSRLQLFSVLFLIALSYLIPVLLNMSYKVGVEMFENGCFKVKNVDGSITSYIRIANCNWPTCDGTVYLDKPPIREEKNYRIIGKCSNEPTNHTFSYQRNQFGYYFKMNFNDMDIIQK